MRKCPNRHLKPKLITDKFLIDISIKELNIYSSHLTLTTTSV